MKNLILIIFLLLLTSCGGSSDSPTVTEIKEPLKIETYNLKLTHNPDNNQPDMFITYTALYEGEHFYFVRFSWYDSQLNSVDAYNNDTMKFNVNKNEITSKIKIQLMDFSGNVLNEREINAN